MSTVNVLPAYAGFRAVSARLVEDIVEPAAPTRGRADAEPGYSPRRGAPVAMVQPAMPRPVAVRRPAEFYSLRSQGGLFAVRRAQQQELLPPTPAFR
ncbi:hypothetical protein SDC9_206909 [bioreactor metagenome]|uniref:Uncharacterized protein n=1 Tax=bioreactor metagenome TaxID=1076179 RepID=A0A645J906_9ZZZZ|nr:hypothetical protein [Propionicimonas sp.]MEA4944477.1 hypothetical protein [Propionicimonas sp.]MEA5052095.1 hypothetical protein [Propionicimonas sp.]MEA5118957.1 hypothetical protein [Propionicimonas sp.]